LFDIDEYLSTSLENQTKKNYKRTTKVIHWMLKTSFIRFFGFCVISYILLTFIFALIIMAIAGIEPQCTTSNVDAFQSKDVDFIGGLNDSWQLSWTTFATVGYGVIAPSTSAIFLQNENDSDRHGTCILMGLFLSSESLFGILFVSFTGAIIFGKLTQFQNLAQIRFSSVMVLKFGEGLEDLDVEDENSINSNDVKEEELDNLDDSSTKKYPCPVLYFRIANSLHYNHCGQVINAQLNTIATVDIKNAFWSALASTDAEFTNALEIPVVGSTNQKLKNQSDHRKASNAKITSNQDGKSNTFNIISRFSSNSEKEGNMRRHLSLNSESLDDEDRAKKTKSRNTVMNLFRQHGIPLTQFNVFDIIKHNNKNQGSSTESDSEKDMRTQKLLLSNALFKSCIIHDEAQLDQPHLVFSKVLVDPDNHPYFTSSWNVAHTLNAESPLLTKEARTKVEQCGGYWPSDMNNEDAIRNGIDFDQFLVGFTGLSKVTGGDVYSHHVYKKEDIHVGYQFSSILVKKQRRVDWCTN